jgi:hypothetical protein
MPSLRSSAFASDAMMLIRLCSKPAAPEESGNEAVDLGRVEWLVNPSCVWYKVPGIWPGGECDGFHGKGEGAT